MKQSKDAHLLSGAYVLNALTPAEVSEMETAMESSEDLRSEIAELTDTAVLLGLSTQPVEPSGAMRARLLALVDVTPQLAPVSSHESAHVTHLELADAAPASRSNVVRGPAHWYRRPSLLLGAAAAAVVLFGGGVLIEQAIVPPATSTNDAAAFASLTAAPDVKHVQAPMTGGGTATVYSSKLQNESAVVLTGEKSAPAGKVMQLWQLGHSSVTSAGLYTPVAGHTYEMMTGVIKPGESLAVTIEPAGGSKQPTTKPIAVVSLS